MTKENERRKAYLKAYRKSNKDKIKAYGKLYREINKDKIKAKNKNYRNNNKNKIRVYGKVYHKKNREKKKVYGKTYRERSEIKVKNKAWRETNKEYLKEYKKLYHQKFEVKTRRNEGSRKRWKIDFKFRLSHCISTGIKYSLNRAGGSKGYNKWEGLVSYDVNDLKFHLEKQFKRGMAWDNYGTYWHIDHRIPVSFFKFDSVNDKDFKDCWALENLQPLEAKENLRKNNNYSEPTLKQFESRGLI